MDTIMLELEKRATELNLSTSGLLNIIKPSGQLVKKLPSLICF